MREPLRTIEPLKGVSEATAIIETNHGTMWVNLFVKQAPKTCANFIGLARGTLEWTGADRQKRKEPFYDGLTFHRVIKGFMIQGGCPLGNGMGGPGYVFADEFHPQLKHTKAGILSMANAGRNTNGSQFFVTLGPTKHLDGKHAVFGEVVQGLDVLKAIGELKCAGDDKPVQDVVIQRVTIETK
jgi:peptidyl-prolyl cis-trans isomerase A (cyclophilin A)